MRQIVYNAVTCLECGETLESMHVHDYKTCSCDNQAMVDGGHDYVRYGAMSLDKVAHEVLYDDDDFEIVRRFHKRGGRGEDGKQPLRYVALSDMSNDWLAAVVNYYPEGHDNYHMRLIKKEIAYRHNTLC